MMQTEKTYRIRLGVRDLETRGRPCLMGIVNVTPDSFSDGGLYDTTATAVEHGLRLVSDGADILDIGGESTRPGAVAVSLEEEMRRVIPVIEALRSTSDIPLSIDTRNAAVAAAAIAAGADIINDVSALGHDPRMIEVAATTAAPVIIMHMQGTPETMQHNPIYDDVVSEIHDFFTERLRRCKAAGIEQIVIDPGIGFGKTREHNLAILANLSRLGDLGVPVLVGVSRKSFIGHITGLPVDQRLPASIAAAVLALRGGATVFRVHDVRESRSALDVAYAILQAEEDVHAG